MPTYTYQCDDCGHSFDVFQKYSEDALTVCSGCKGVIRRVIQPTAIVFKGSGWYINDSKGKNSVATTSAKDDETKVETKAETTTEPKAESKTETKTESKSESKTETSVPAKAKEPVAASTS